MNLYAGEYAAGDQLAYDYIEARRRLYEKTYGIKVLFWCVRKSILRGMCRQQSDLDIAFVFQNRSFQPRKIIFERADRRNEFLCWNIEDLLLTAGENKALAQETIFFRPHYSSSIHRHYFLDYYNACYCYFGSPLKGDPLGFIEQNLSVFENLYSPLIPVNMFLPELDHAAEKIGRGETLSLNEYLYSVWCALASEHLLRGGMPGDVDILNLGRSYLENEDLRLLKTCVAYFRNTAQKQSNFCRIERFNRFILEACGTVRERCRTFAEAKTDIPGCMSQAQKSIETLG